MIEGLYRWVVSVLAAALLVSLVRTLIPQGTLKRLASLTGGVILMLTLLSPLRGIEIGLLSLDWEELSEGSERREELLRTAEEEQLCAVIEEKLEAYISDKARELGVTTTVEIRLRADGDGGILPDRAELSCGYSQSLSRRLEQELGIPKERQVFHGSNTVE